MWTPYVEMYHFESQTGTDADGLRAHGAAPWSERLYGDPYYNPNLQATEAMWTPAHDWDLVTRSWAEPIEDVGTVDVEGYLEVNDDLAIEAGRNPDFDVLGHLHTFGGREGRIYIRRRETPDLTTATHVAGYG